MKILLQDLVVDATFDAFVAGDQAQAVEKGASITGRGKKMINGIDARWFQADFTHDGFRYSILTYSFLRGRRIYSVIMSIDASDFEPFKDEIVRSMESFTFTP